MAITFGHEPVDIRVVVSANADFIQPFTNPSGEDYDPATLFELRFEGGPTWTATIDGADGLFSVDKADVASDVVNAGIRTCRLFYVLGDDDEYLGVGPVVVKK